jgi:hypothetical protein
MPWFKVSDDLPSKAQTTRIPRAYRRAALGLWALAGAWSAQQLTDGHIPDYMLEELSGTPEDAAWLVTAEYWAVVEDGWQFVEWAPEQPLREVVLEARRKNAAKVKDWRSRNQASNSVTPPVTDSATNQPVTLPPSRPNPVPSQSTSKEVELHVHPAAARSIEDEFSQFWNLYPRKQGKADALRAYKVVRKAVEAKTIRDGAQAYALLKIGEDKNFLKLPAGWLRDGRWDDEQIPSTDRSSFGGRPLTRTERNLAVIAQYADMEGTQRSSRRIISGRNRDAQCPQHPGYPLEPACAACERELEEGRAF